MFGAPAGGQASIAALSLTSPVTALASPVRVVVVVTDAFARTGRPAIVRQARKKRLQQIRERTAEAALAARVSPVSRWPTLSLFKLSLCPMLMRRMTIPTGPFRRGPAACYIVGLSQWRV